MQSSPIARGAFSLYNLAQELAREGSARGGGGGARCCEQMLFTLANVCMVPTPHSHRRWWPPRLPMNPSLSSTCISATKRTTPQSHYGPTRAAPADF